MADLNGDLRSIADLVDEAGRLNILFAGTKTQPGLLAKVQDASDQVASAAERLGDASQLSKQLQALPERLLKPADEMQFRTALQESMAAALGGAIEDARQAAISAGLSVAEDDLKAAAESIFGDAIELRTELEAEKLMLAQVRKMLAERDGALQHSRDVFFGETERLAGIYQTKGTEMAESFAEATTKAVNKINAQNNWLPLKYAFFTFGGLVAGFAMHDSIYLQITKFMQ